MLEGTRLEVQSNADSDSTPTASARSITLNLITGGFGIGMFSLPWSTAGASLIPGLCMIGLIVALNGCTISILIEGADKHGAFDLGALLGHLGGKRGMISQVLCSTAVWTTLYLTQVGYTLIMVDAVHTMLGARTPGRTALVFIVSLAMLPLSLLNQKYLSFTSQLAVAVNLYILFVTSFEDKNPEGMCLLGYGPGMISMASVMAQAVVVQMCVLPMYRELEDRSPQKFNRIVQVAFTTLAVIFSAFVVMGYITYGASVSDNILHALPNNMWGKSARIAAGLSVACVYPIFEQAMVAPCWNLPARYRRPGYFAATVFTVAATALGALVLRTLGLINVINGSLASIAFVGLCPSVVGLCLLERDSGAWRAAMIFLLIVPTCAGCLGLVFTDNYEEELMKHCIWSLD